MVSLEVVQMESVINEMDWIFLINSIVISDAWRKEVANANRMELLIPDSN